jgi:hypothetical protein
MSDYFPLMHKIAESDVYTVKEKDKQYGGSWKKRGGVGAFMMLARKWDRLEQFVQNRSGWDIFLAISSDQRDEGVIDDIRDLRQYLLLVETEMMTRLKRPINAAENAKAADDGPAMTDQEVRDIIGRQAPDPREAEQDRFFRPLLNPTPADIAACDAPVGKRFNTLTGTGGGIGGPVSTGVPIGPSTGLTGVRPHVVSPGSFPARSVPRGGFGPRGFDPAQDVAEPSGGIDPYWRK